MHIEYFTAIIFIFIFDMRGQHVQQSGGKSKDKSKEKGNPGRIRNNNNPYFKKLEINKYK